MSTGGGDSISWIRSSASMPSIPGILMSRRTASGRRASSSASPDGASRADAVSYPSYSRIIRIASRTDASSSMIRTRGTDYLLADLDDREERHGAGPEAADVEAEVVPLLRVAHDFRELGGRPDLAPVHLGDHVAFRETRIGRRGDLRNPRHEDAGDRRVDPVVLARLPRQVLDRKADLLPRSVLLLVGRRRILRGLAVALAEVDGDGPAL